MAVSEAIQTISKLTPLVDILLTVDGEVKPVTPRTIDVFAAAGRTLAADALAPSRPASALALQDGWALSADETLGAGGHAPSPLVRTPSRIEAGRRCPPERIALHRLTRSKSSTVAPKRFLPSIQARVSWQPEPTATRRSRCVEPVNGCAVLISQHFPRRGLHALRCASRVFAFSRARQRHHKCGRASGGS